MIPPDADAEFAAHIEEVLETYARPLDCDCPVLCMDEQPVQLIRETRTPMPATRDRPCRVDYEYERAGTASVSLHQRTPTRQPEIPAFGSEDERDATLAARFLYAPPPAQLGWEPVNALAFKLE